MVQEQEEGEVMRSFNDWYFDLFESGNGACLNQQEIAEEAWDYRQTEVDDLNQELNAVLNNWNDLTKAIHARTNGTAVAEARQLYEKVEELQKRVQFLEMNLRFVKEHFEMNDLDKAMPRVYEELEQALKGGKDE